jgi:hypothetical protein
MQLDGRHVYVNDILSPWLFPLEFNVLITPINTHFLHPIPTPPLSASSTRSPAGVDPSSRRSLARHGPRLPCWLVASSPIKDRACGWCGRPRGGLLRWIYRPSSHLEGGSGDASPSPASLLQSHFEGSSGDVTRCEDDEDAIGFTLVSFYFSTY